MCTHGLKSINEKTGRGQLLCHINGILVRPRNRLQLLENGRHYDIGLPGERPTCKACLDMPAKAAASAARARRRWSR